MIVSMPCYKSTGLSSNLCQGSQQPACQAGHPPLSGWLVQSALHFCIGLVTGTPEVVENLQISGNPLKNPPQAPSFQLLCILCQSPENTIVSFMLL